MKRSTTAIQITATSVKSPLISDSTLPLPAARAPSTSTVTHQIHRQRRCNRFNAQRDIARNTADESQGHSNAGRRLKRRCRTKEDAHPQPRSNRPESLEAVRWVQIVADPRPKTVRWVQQTSRSTDPDRQAKQPHSASRAQQFCRTAQACKRSRDGVTDVEEH
jgi:hypothetical protein